MLPLRKSVVKQFLRPLGECRGASGTLCTIALADTCVWTRTTCSLISPLSYGGDFRPYFTIYDRDFKEIADLHDSSKGNKLPPAILGVTNPIFLKVFKHWRNTLVYTRRQAGGMSAPFIRRSRSTSIAKPQVVSKTADLESVVATKAGSSGQVRHSLQVAAAGHQSVSSHHLLTLLDCRLV